MKHLFPGQWTGFQYSRRFFWQLPIPLHHVGPANHELPDHARANTLTLVVDDVDLLFGMPRPTDVGRASIWSGGRYDTRLHSVNPYME